MRGVTIAERILVELGFAKVTRERAGASDKDDGTEKRIVRFAAARLGVVEHAGAVNVLRGNTSLAKGTKHSGGRLEAATYLPERRRSC